MELTRKCIRQVTVQRFLMSFNEFDKKDYGLVFKRILLAQLAYTYSKLYIYMLVRQTAYGSLVTRPNHSSI